jgi:hypothetical protein
MVIARNLLRKFVFAQQIGKRLGRFATFKINVAQIVQRSICRFTLSGGNSNIQTMVQNAQALFYLALGS